MGDYLTMETWETGMYHVRILAVLKPVFPGGPLIQTTAQRLWYGWAIEPYGFGAQKFLIGWQHHVLRPQPPNKIYAKPTYVLRSMFLPRSVLA